MIGTKTMAADKLEENKDIFDMVKRQGMRQASFNTTWTWTWTSACLLH